MTKETPTGKIRNEMKWVYFVGVAIASVLGSFFMLKGTVDLHGQAIETLKESATLRQQAIDTLEKTTTTLEASFNFYHGTK